MEPKPRVFGPGCKLYDRVSLIVEREKAKRLANPNVLIEIAGRGYTRREAIELLHLIQDALIR